MENLKRVVFRWRHLVLIAEAAAIAGCAYSALSLTGPSSGGPAAKVIRGHALAASPSPLGIPFASANPAPGRASHRTPAAVSPGLLDHINHDDLVLYQEERRLLRAALDAARRYLQQQVLPALRQAKQSRRDGDG